MHQTTRGSKIDIRCYAQFIEVMIFSLSVGHGRGHDVTFTATKFVVVEVILRSRLDGKGGNIKYKL